MNSSLAPIVIPTMNRFNHLKKCVESLKRCTHATNTDLFIALDYPSKESLYDGYKKVRSYVRSISGFGSLNVIERSENYGAFGNFVMAKEEVFNIYGRLIASEDDNVFAPNFLDYINKGLVRFHDDPRIIAICGDGGTIQKPEDYSANYLYRKGFSAWGYGAWKERLGKLEYSTTDMREFVADSELRKRLKYYYERHYYSTLSYITRGATMRGDGAIALDMIKNDTYCVYPTVSKVRNHGHDGSGEHGGKLKDSPYSKVVIDDSEHFEFQGDPVFDDPRYLAILRNRTRFTPKQKLKFWLRAAQKPEKMLDLWKLVH